MDVTSGTNPWIRTQRWSPCPLGDPIASRGGRIGKGRGGLGTRRRGARGLGGDTREHCGWTGVQLAVFALFGGGVRKERKKGERSRRGQMEG